MKRARYQWEHTGITKPGVLKFKNIYQAQLVGGALGAFKRTFALLLTLELATDGDTCVTLPWSRDSLASTSLAQTWQLAVVRLTGAASPVVRCTRSFSIVGNAVPPVGLSIVIGNSSSGQYAHFLSKSVLFHSRHDSCNVSMQD